MTAPKWHQQRVVAFDTETTGTDPADARIVTSAIVHMEPGQRPRALRWVIDPGVEIPAEAAEVHGWTNQRLADTIGRPDYALRILNGIPTRIPREVAIFEIVAQVAATIGRGQALVVHNAPYDLTLLEAEAIRHDVDPVASRPAGLAGVVDPMVIEKAFDPYRKTCYRKGPDADGNTVECDRETPVHVCSGCRGGKWACNGCGTHDKTLTSLCAHYGVVHAGAHDAADDAIATVRLLGKLLAAWPQLGTWRLETLHGYQQRWRAEQQAGLRKFFDRVGKEHDGCCVEWPIHQACVRAGVAA